MKPLMAGSSMPRAKPGDFEKALALLAATGADKKTREYLLELQDATAAHVRAREEAETAERKAAERDKAAHRAELDATVSRQALADESAEARATLGKRETAVAERERVAGEAEKSQEARDKELQRREDHLREAGVRGF